MIYHLPSKFLLRHAAILLAICFSASSIADDRGCKEPVFDVCSRLQESLNSPDRRIALLEEARVLLENGLSESIGQPVVHAQWLRMQWFYHFLQDQHAESLPFLESAVELLETEGSRLNLLLEYYSNLAWTHRLLGNFATAMSLSREAASISLEHEPSRTADFYHELGLTHESLGELDIAKSYYETARELYFDSQDEFGLIVIDGKLATILRQQGRSLEAVELHTRTMEHFETLFPYRSLVAKIELAKNHVELGNWNSVYQFAAEAWSDPRTLDTNRIDAGLALISALTYGDIATDDTEDGFSVDSILHEIAELLSQKTTGPNGKTVYPTKRLQYLKSTIDFHSGQEQAKQVAYFGQKGIELIGQVADELRGSGDNFFAWMATTQPFFNSYVVALKNGRQEEIPWILDDRYDWRQRQDIVRSANTVTTAIAHQEIEALNDVVAAEKALLVLTSDSSNTSVNDVSEETRTLKRQRDLALEAYLGERALRSASHSAPLTRSSKHSISQKDIASTDIVLRYFVQNEDSFVIALTRDETHHMQLPPRDTLRELIQKTTDAIGSGSASGSELMSLLTQLNTLLPLDFIYRQNQASRIVMIPDDAVHLAPMSAINLAATSGEPFRALGSQYEVLRTHSMGGYYGSAAPVDATSSNTEPSIVVLANPIVDQSSLADIDDASLIARWLSETPPLPYSVEEGRHISALFPAHSVSTHFGEAFTKRALKSEQTRSANVLHIATHGLFDARLPDIVGLLTSTDSRSDATSDIFFSITDMLGQTYSNQLVIVSGCETMRGREYSGIGIKSVSQMFLARGAGSAIGTLWKIPDQGSAEFMRRFHSHLKDSDGNASRALKLTRTDMARSRRYANPYYWAGFVLDSTSRNIDTNVFGS